ncbi:hypothetical protein Gotri_024234 [Gossypium trilobum]|uniref:hAT-like transposase RNase-H fold domain-containing protein n=2 Tax=Gossypium TaxID=3633 RepID=A0A7J9DLL4_9ROSI|nr:hypothetical protein [Gossypium trilobum]
MLGEAHARGRTLVAAAPNATVAALGFQKLFWAFGPHCNWAFVFRLVRCCTHILNLIVKVRLELANDVVGKIRNGIKYIKKVGNSWNSTYLTLESTLYYKDVLDYWGQWDKDYQIFALSDEEWGNVATLCKFLKVFYDMTFVFSGSNYLTANLYFKGVWKVHKYCFTTIYGAHDSNFVQNILSNLKLLFEEYVKNSKSMSSSLAGISNVSDNDHVDSSLHEVNINRVDLGGDYDESDDYRRYLSESNTKSERSQLDVYLEEPELELNSQIDVLDY